MCLLQVEYDGAGVWDVSQGMREKGSGVMLTGKPIKIRLERNGRIWKRKPTVQGEEVLDIVVDGVKFHRGLCVGWFRKLTGIHIAKGEIRTVYLVEELT